MYKILVIGCGNIGALYDIDNEQVTTHVKAWHLHTGKVELSVFDLNKELAAKVSTRYGCGVIDDINVEVLSRFDGISLCTPTGTHTEILLMAFKAGVKMIICEKPVAARSEDLDMLENQYNASDTKVIVNYIRRFQPAYERLKERIEQLKLNEKLTNIKVTYQRGFINNCSHAFDLIQYLFGEELILSGISRHNQVNDHFQEDPTLSINAMWGDVNIDVLGLGNVLFAYFEIELFFELTKITIENAGNLIRVMRAESGSGFLKPLSVEDYTEQDCLKDYMKPVTAKALAFLTGSRNQDNFIEAVQLNKQMLNYLKV